MKQLIIWAFCQICCIRTEQELDHEDKKREYYRCKSCNCIHAYAVR